MSQETEDTAATAFTVERVRADAAHILAEPAEDIDPAEDLFDRGMDSVRMMSLMEQWRSAGVEVDFADLAERPTIDAWVALLNG